MVLLDYLDGRGVGNLRILENFDTGANLSS
jgi:hypothetical protein